MTMYQGLDHQGEIPRINDPQPRYQRIYDELDVQGVYINELSKRVSSLENTVRLLLISLGTQTQLNGLLRDKSPTQYQSSDHQELQARLDKSEAK